MKKALGTTSSDFVNSSLIQIQAAARSPLSGMSPSRLCYISRIATRVASERS
jgi:hypothetical protein